MTNHHSETIATVYSRPGCMRCHVTHRKIKAMGIPVDLVQIDEHPEKIAYMEVQGWMELPLVQVNIPTEGEVHYWAGMSERDLDALKYLVQGDQRAGKGT